MNLIFLLFSGNFQNRNLGPYAWDQLSTIYFVPDNVPLDPSLSYNLEADVLQELMSPELDCSFPLSDHEDHDHHLQSPEHPVLFDFIKR